MVKVSAIQSGSGLSNNQKTLEKQDSDSEEVEDYDIEKQNDLTTTLEFNASDETFEEPPTKKFKTYGFRVIN